MNNSLPSGMVIEFMSTPGAGKTTLLPVVAGFFSERGWTPFSVMEAARSFALRTWAGQIVRRVSPLSLREPLLWQVFYQASKRQRADFRRNHVALLRSVIDFQRTRPLTNADHKHVMRWFLNLTGQYQFLTVHAQPHETLLFDESFAHRVVQLFASESETPDLERIQAYLDLIPQPDLIVHPRASLQTCIQRVRQRGVWERFLVKEETAFLRFMENANAIVNFAVNYLIAKGWNIVEVDNEAQPAMQTAFALQQKLTELYSVRNEFVTLMSV
jgi:hypothetical protein